jgi:hypothetical protein
LCNDLQAEYLQDCALALRAASEGANVQLEVLIVNQRLSVAELVQIYETSRVHRCYFLSAFLQSSCGAHNSTTSNSSSYLSHVCLYAAVCMSYGVHRIQGFFCCAMKNSVPTAFELACYHTLLWLRALKTCTASLN